MTVAFLSPSFSGSWNLLWNNSNTNFWVVEVLIMCLLYCLSSSQADSAGQFLMEVHWTTGFVHQTLPNRWKEYAKCVIKLAMGQSDVESTSGPLWGPAIENLPFVFTWKLKQNPAIWLFRKTHQFKNFWDWCVELWSKIDPATDVVMV